MTTISKDQSITTQVAFKGAVDLAVAAGGDLTTLLGNFVQAFDALRDVMNDAHGFSGGDVVAEAEQLVRQSFPRTTAVSAADTRLQAVEMHSGDLYSQPFGAADITTVRVKGDQHGPLPDWLLTAAKKAGVTEVYDNRAELSSNPKRPWFKATSGGRDAAAFWPPRG